MTNDALQGPTDAAGFHADEGLHSDLAWWLTGGAALLVWTGIVLLLTSA